MPNLGSVLREEITRLARRAARGQIDLLKKTSAQQRRHIAALRRDITQLTRQLVALGRRATGSVAQGTPAPAGRRVRFVAKGLRSQRERLGLSQAEFGKLVGVSAQSIYQWERGATRPRATQLNTLASLRSIGKKEARARLSASSGASKRRKRTKR